MESMLQQDMVVRTKQGAGKKIKQTAILNIEGGRLGNSSGEQRNALVPEGQVDMGGDKDLRRRNNKFGTDSQKSWIAMLQAHLGSMEGPKTRRIAGCMRGFLERWRVTKLPHLFDPLKRPSSTTATSNSYETYSDPFNAWRTALTTD